MFKYLIILIKLFNVFFIYNFNLTWIYSVGCMKLAWLFVIILITFILNIYLIINSIVYYYL